MSQPRRLLGLDFGERRIGVAVSDALGITAQPLITIQNKKGQALRAIQALINTYQVETIVVGLPRHLSGREGEKAVAARAFGEQLRADTGLRVEYMDERLSTAAAQRVLQESHLPRQRKRQVIDQMAAALILQTWLERSKR